MNYLCNFLKWAHQTLPLNTVVKASMGEKYLYFLKKHNYGHLLRTLAVTRDGRV